MTFKEGVEFAGYRVGEVVGRGGMGVVYRATDISLDRPVALKVISADLAANPGFRRRFEAESRTAASLDHPNVIPIFAAGEHEGSLFLAMRFVDGDDLRDEIKARGPLAPERVSRIATQIASALDAAHLAGLVHRDVKPANILLTPGDHAYLTDFGLTKRVLSDPDETQTGHLLGTLNYVAPEQIRGQPVDARTDVYALGCVLFHALTATVPFAMREHEAKLWAHLSEPPPLASRVAAAPEAVDPVIARAMAKDPAERFDSAGELAHAFAIACGLDEPAVERAPPRPGPDRSRVAEPNGDRAALVRRALVAPFSLAVLAGCLAAGLALGLMPAALGVAVAGYAASVWVMTRDEQLRRKVAAAADPEGSRG